MFGFIDKMYGRSSQWRKVRAEHLKKHPTCAACGRKEGLEVHHIVPYHISPERELDPTNLITLCGKYCHFVFGHFMDWKSWNDEVIQDCEDYAEAKAHRCYSYKFGAANKERPNAIFYIILSYLLWPFIPSDFWDKKP
jgi:5-methylcytosine-specific restriction enzyme A